MKLTKQQEHRFERFREKSVEQLYDRYHEMNYAVKEAKKQDNKEAESKLYANMKNIRKAMSRAEKMTPELMYKLNKRAKNRRRLRTFLILLILAVLAYYYFFVR